MITRRFIRTRVLQSIYAFKVSKNKIELEEKELLSSLEKMKVLYVVMLLLIVKLKYTAKKRLSTKKSIEDYYKINLENLADSKVIEIIESNKEYKLFLDNNKLENFWDNNKTYLTSIIDDLYKTEKQKTRNILEEADFLKEIYIEYISGDTKMHDFLETNNIYWSDDIQVINSLILKTFENIDYLMGTDKLLTVFKDSEDKKFMINLFLETTKNIENLDAYIFKASKNWEKDRISKIDIVLLEMGMTEYNLYNKEIPYKIILNEYIEIAKEFSSKKSYIFINGILDKYFKSKM